MLESILPRHLEIIYKINYLHLQVCIVIFLNSGFQMTLLLNLCLDF